MEIPVLIILITCGVIIFYAQRAKYKKELAELAKESSERIQEYHVKLVKVCMEPDGLEAKQIITLVKFNVEAEQSLWMGDKSSKNDEILHNTKGIWAHIKEQQEGGLG